MRRVSAGRVTRLLVLRSQNAEMPNITYRHGHVHIHAAHISTHRRVKQTGTRNGLSPLNVSTGSDSHACVSLFFSLNRVQNAKRRPTRNLHTLLLATAAMHTLNVERLL